ncbi:hypothetical protein LBMAG15_12370 [Actinomycetes bacterium]|nr:hypothetical protein LBMAG15_12370 [Actinomycetes bacterium]
MGGWNNEGLQSALAATLEFPNLPPAVPMMGDATVPVRARSPANVAVHITRLARS